MIKWTSILIVLLIVNNTVNAQDTIKRKWILTTQYAGSTGLASGGLSVGSRKNKLELGFLFGFVPERYGGPIQTFSLKFVYNPFRLHLSDRFCWEPLQTGVFITQYSGDNFSLRWEDKYPKGYYWWPKSTRQHIFLATQTSWLLRKKHADRVSLFLEANTNDLYLYSYLPNVRSIKFYEIIFLGTGVKLYLK